MESFHSAYNVLMDKLKLLIILVIGSITLFYNLINSCFIDLFKQTEVAVLFQGQISSYTRDSYIGMLFDYLIGFLFNINIKDMESCMRIFGG